MNDTPRIDHNASAPALPQAAAPWWEDGQTITDGVKEPAFLAHGIMAFWQSIRRWLLTPLAEQDPLTCTPALLELIAWERDITRFKGEPLDLFRKRVKFAFINARAAGGTAGFVDIFGRFDITLRAQMERIDGMEWDIILLLLDEHSDQLTERLAHELVKQYRRTCRRYDVGVTAFTDQQLGCAEFSASYQTITASTDVDLAGSVWGHCVRAAQPISASYVTTEAKWPKS
ncbi:hypothetical protein MT389_00310 [Aeromonas salmonicida]|uniref:hypothetical protein n=1 Tax=Aeromonas salmonicida TaxID=645 RepID=UPI00111B20DD|nr:hypothetical protein [Aeromonas salmonicida]TNI89505.1 hypothetical protein CF133_02920 [Aeromonas salmonicida]